MGVEYLQVGFISWHQPRRWADFAGGGGASRSVLESMHWLVAFFIFELTAGEAMSARHCRACLIEAGSLGGPVGGLIRCQCEYLQQWGRAWRK